MKDRPNDPKLEELSPQYDHFVDMALDYLNDQLLPEDAVAFRDRMKTDEMFRRVVQPVIDAHYGPRSSDDVIRAGWNDLRNRIAAAGGTALSAEAIEHALAERTTFEQRVKARSRMNWRLIARVAAVFAFLMLIPISFMVYVELFQMRETATQPHVTSVVRLPEKTVVNLEPESRLRYPKNLADRRTRWVNLEGEGEFIVTHNAQSPFEVHTRWARVTVIGTKFTVQANDLTTVVIVEEGKVMVQPLDGDDRTSGRPVVFSAGQRVRVTEAGIIQDASDSKAGGRP